MVSTNSRKLSRACAKERMNWWTHWLCNIEKVLSRSMPFRRYTTKRNCIENNLNACFPAGISQCVENYTRANRQTRAHMQRKIFQEKKMPKSRERVFQPYCSDRSSFTRKEYQHIDFLFCVGYYMRIHSTVHYIYPHTIIHIGAVDILLYAHKRAHIHTLTRMHTDTHLRARIGIHWLDSIER